MHQCVGHVLALPKTYNNSKTVPPTPHLVALSTARAAAHQPSLWHLWEGILSLRRRRRLHAGCLTPPHACRVIKSICSLLTACAAVAVSTAAPIESPTRGLLQSSRFDSLRASFGIGPTSSGSTHHSSTTPKYKSTTGTTVSSVQCSATATSETFAEAKNVHISAMAEMAVSLCVRDAGGSYADSVLDEPRDFGFALAAALASTQASCVAAGNAFGCATAFAVAEAWAEASIEAHSAAVAEALVLLKSDDMQADMYGTCASASCDVEAVSFSIGSSSLYLELMAEVFAQAQSTACAIRDSEASATAFRGCVAHAYADVWTRVRAETYPCATAVTPTEVEITTPPSDAVSAAVPGPKRCIATAPDPAQYASLAA